MHHRQQRRTVSMAGNKAVVQLAAEVIALRGGMHVELGELEGVGKPFSTDGRTERRGDLLAPPQPWLTAVAIAEADQPIAEVERAKGPKPAVRRVPPHGVSKAKHPRVPPRKPERRR